MAGKTDENSSKDPQYGQRKVSLSDTLSRFTTNSFTRRRTAPDANPSTTAIPPQDTNQPNTTKIPRSSSFFSSLNSFIPRVANSNNTKEHRPAASTKSLHHSRTYSQRVSQPPSSFFNTASLPEDVIEPLLPKAFSSATPKHRESVGTQITQRGLMKPITNPPLPRRSTMGNLVPDSSTQTPGFMRPTSSSAARRATPRVASTTYPLPKTVTPTKRRARPSDQTYQPSKLSILSAPAPSEGKGQKESLAVDSPKMSSELDIDDSGLASQRIFQHKAISSTTHLLADSEPQDTTMDSGLPSPHFSEATELSSTANTLANLEYEDTVMGPALPSPLIFQDKKISSTTNLLADLEPEDTIIASDAMLGEDAEHPEEATGDPNEDLVFIPNSTQITTAQPTGYWLGRITALSDRFRSEALLSPTSAMHDDGRRMRRVFTHLRDLCATPDAIASLEAFQQQWAVRNEGRDSGAGTREASSGAGKKVKEKRGVFEVMMGRKK